MDWLKRAEDLFEVVDRRAKLVANELTDEQSTAPPTASNGKVPRGKRSKTRAKKKASVEANVKKGDSAQEDSSLQPSVSDSKPDEPLASTVVDYNGSTQGNSTARTNIEVKDQTDNDSNVHVTASDTSSTDVSKHDDRQQGEAGTSDIVVTSSSNGDLSSDTIPSVSSAVDTEVCLNNHLIDSGQSIELKDADDSVRHGPGEDKFHPIVDVVPSSVITEKQKVNTVETASEPISDPLKQEDEKEKTSLHKVQEQLEEAQGLIKSTNPTGQSKEARLARVCAGLSSRLQEYKSENVQLEELLTAERELSKSFEGRIKQLQQELSSAKTEVNRVESYMAEALAAKNSEIETLVSSLDTLKKQAALSKGNMSSLQANMETLMRNRDLTETRMMQALKEELALADRRVEEERVAHNATKKAAMEREVELEHRAVDSSTALARLQRMAEDKAAKAGELEQKVALLEAECASLNQELHDMEGRLRREQKKSPEDGNQLIQIQTWQQEVERARQGQQDAEIKFSSLEAELQKMRVEMAAMKRDAEQYSRQEHMELEKRFRELTDLLYYKQTQLETMASEKAAAEFQLDKEIKRLQEAQAEGERSKISRRASSSWDEEADMRELEPLTLHQRHLAGANVQLRKAAKLLDSGAVSATRILWRHPRARVGLLFYLVFVHLFLLYLLHRLQAQADDFADREVAQSMGLSQPNLP